MTCVCVYVSVWTFFVSSSNLLRGIDDSGVVSELQGANHSRADAHHQRKRYLLQDKRETGSAVSGDNTHRFHGVTESVTDTATVWSSIREDDPSWETPRHMYPFTEKKTFFGRLIVLYLHVCGKLKTKSESNQV